jgi:hypothetical protein
MGKKLKRGPLLTGQEAASHDAVGAWRQLGTSSCEVTAVQPLKRSKHGGVYRLFDADRGGRNVCAKRGWREDIEKEHLVYRELLPKLGLPTLRSFGLLEDPHPKRWWLFIEDAGDQRYDRHDESNVFALTDWLAMLHSAGERLATECVPRRGPAEYLHALREGRARIEANLGNPAIAPEAVEILEDLIALETKVEAQWDEIELVCADLPETLVHGDIKPKNLRMRADDAVPPIHVFDWEMAGWGVPAADLERVDLDRYLDTRTRLGLSFDPERLPRLAKAGRLFCLLAAIEWASQSLTSDWVAEPVEELQRHHERLIRLIGSGALPC